MNEKTDIEARVMKFFDPPDKLTFLIGAGCSLDAPSNIPNTKIIMETIIEYICAQTECENINNLDDLRFEALMEVFRNSIDSNLKVIDFFEEFKFPNSQHYFLAEVIKNNSFVLTTNFDFLIEYALLKSGIPMENIKIVITESDFKTYANPKKNMEKGKKLLYKIHGSTKNIIKDLDTRDSLKATIQALGSNKMGMDIFSIEKFKKPLFENISKKRNLIIMGYSGSDDFDIVPTLKLLKDLGSLIWINHIEEDAEIKITKIVPTMAKDIQNSGKINQILMEIVENSPSLDVFRVDINTSNLIEYLNEQFGFNVEKKENNSQSISLKSWLRRNIPINKNEEKFIKYFIPAKIYLNFDMYEEVERCANEIFKKAKSLNYNFWEGISSFFLGRIYRNIYKTKASENSFKSAILSFKKSLNEEEKDKQDILPYLLKSKIEHANVRANQGMYKDAIKVYHNVLEQIKFNSDLKDISANCHVYLGNAFRNLGKFTESIENYQKAIELFQKIGNIRDQGTCMFNLALSYRDLGNFSFQKDFMDKSLDIARKISDIRGESKALGGIACSYANLNKYNKACRLYKKSFELIENQKADLIKSYLFEDFAKTELINNNINSAREFFKKALNLVKEKRHKLLIKRRLSYIALTYLLEDNLEKAEIIIQKALSISDSEDSILIKDFMLNINGIINLLKSNNDRAAKIFTLVSNIVDEKLNDEEDNYLAYSNQIIALMGTILTSEEEDLEKQWSEQLELHDIKLKKFNSKTAFREFELFGKLMKKINSQFYDSKRSIFKPT